MPLDVTTCVSSDNAGPSTIATPSRLPSTFARDGCAVGDDDLLNVEVALNFTITRAGAVADAPFSVSVPDAAVSLIRPVDAWPPLLNTVIGAAMPLITAAYLGIADGAVETALRLVAGRTDQHILQLTGELVNAHTTAEDLVAAMFAGSEDLNFANTDAYAARTLSRKTVAAEQLIATVRLAMETVGGVGYSRGCDIERRYRDVHGILFHPLPRAKQLLFSGRVALGHGPLG